MEATISQVTRQTLSSLGIEKVLRLLAEGDLAVTGQFVWGSNYTFLALVDDGETRLEAVYKPSYGEQPLWDFPAGSLASREVAAYVASQALGCDLVPPTVLREGGPAGPGSLQVFVDADPNRHYFTFSEGEKQGLQTVALFDILINNADRKGGHVLLSPDDHLWLIDHGVCFHAEYKLRTVIWEFVGEPIPEPLLERLSAFKDTLARPGPVRQQFEQLLSMEEIEALGNRAERLLTDCRFPDQGVGRPFPWPLV